MIPDEAVEAAYQRVWPYWDEPEEVVKDVLRMAFKAALPFLSEAARQPQRTSPTDWPDLPKAKS